MLTRRRFLQAVSTSLLAGPLVAEAQQPAMPVIGFLGGESPVLFATFLRLFHEGLNEAGFVEGKNVAIEYRWAEGRNERLPALAADLVRRQVRVIAAPGTTPAALAAKNATATIPVVIFTAGDPIKLGLAASLNRPGGNVALLINPRNPTLAESTTAAAQAAARIRTLQLHVLRAGAEADFDHVFTALVQLRASGLVIAIDSFFTGRREQLAALALRHGIPASYQYRDFAEAGGLMSYGGTAEPYRLAGLYTGRILKGENPAELPIHQATTVELIVNLKTAKALRLTIPQSILARADELIE